MVANDVSGIHDLANNIGTLLHKASNQKKSSMNVVLGQDLQQTQGVGIVGSVIVSEC